MPMELVMPSNHLILCHPLLLLPSIIPSIRVFSNKSALRIRWPKYWSFSFNISLSNEHPGHGWMCELDYMVMYGCVSWTTKKAEHGRIDAFELWCWRRLLRVPWTARRSNQSILKEISPGCSLVGLLIMKLKLQYFGHLMQRADSFEKTLMLGNSARRRRKGWQRMGWLDVSPTRWTWVWVDSRSWWWTGRPGMLQFMGLQRVRHNWATELNRTEVIFKLGFSAASELIISPWYLPCRHALLLFSQSVMSDSATWWTAAHHIPLSFINCWSLLKLTSTESVMPSNRILCHPPLLLPSVFPSIRVFSNELALCIRWPNYWSFSFSISPYSEYSGLISFKIDWFDLLVIHGTLKNLLQHRSLRASILQCSVFFMVQLSHSYMTAGKTTALLYRSLSAKWCLLFNMLSEFVTAFLPRSKHRHERYRQNTCQ